jgi:hypothetical protein
MPATSVAILSLPPRTAAPFLSGAWAERAAFFSIGLVAAQFAPRPNHSLDQTQPWWRSATGRRSGDAVGDAASQHADVALVDHGGDREEVGWNWWTRLEGEESCI